MELWLLLRSSVSAPPGVITAYSGDAATLPGHTLFSQLWKTQNHSCHSSESHRSDCSVGLYGVVIVECGLQRGFPSPIYPSMCV